MRNVREISMNGLTRRQWLGGLGVVALVTGWRDQAASQEAKVVIVSWGGDYQDALRDAYWKPFTAATKVAVVEDTRPLPPRIKAMVESGKVDWDVVDLTDGQYTEVHKFGGFDPIDYAKLDAEALKQIDTRGHRPDAVMHQMASMGLAYRTDVFKGDKPKSWADFWDVKKFPGPRALGAPIGAGAYGTLEIALLADGVALNKLYPIDMDRAFRKLDQIKPDVVKWYTTAVQPQQLLVDKEAVMTAAFSARTFILKEKGAPVDFVWNQAMAFPMVLAIPKGAKNRDNAHRLISYMLQAENQARYGNIYYYGVANKRAYEKIPAARGRMLTTFPENLPLQFVQDAEWWGKNAIAVNDRWNKWVLQ
jgi:putative spermidine/putrescine transport system substrate-binding protein